MIDAKSVMDYRTHLPKETVEETIVGRNHAQFRDHGAQIGDGVPMIASE